MSEQDTLAVQVKELEAQTKKLVVANKLDEAVALLVPHHRKVLWDVGEQFLNVGDLAHAFVCWRKAVTLLPDDQYLQIRLIRALFDADKRADALAVAKNFKLSVSGVDRSDLTAEEKMLYCITENIAIVSPEGVAGLVRLTDHVARYNIPGAFVECGVYKGGGVAIMMHALMQRGQSDREFHLFDTFAGMPVPGERDVYADGRSAHEEWALKLRPDGNSGWVVSTLDDTRRFIKRTGYPPHKVHYVEGMVEDTISGAAPEQIALLRLDTDFFSSTLHELDRLYPRLASGGVLIIYDYGAFKGSQLATDQYFERMGLKLMLHRIDCNSRVAIKP